MSTNQIGLEIPQKELNFKIGSDKNSFSVVVINYSDQFASFQIELLLLVQMCKQWDMSGIKSLQMSVSKFLQGI